MRGRYEKPRNGRHSNPVPKAPARDPRYGDRTYRNSEDAYSQESGSNSIYSADPYQEAAPHQDFYGQQNDYSEEPYEEQPHQPIFYDQDAPSYDRGTDPYGQEYNSYEQEPQYAPAPRQKSGWGWGVLSFFLPVVGLILFLCWKKRKPRAAKTSGICALAGLILNLVLLLVLAIGGAYYYNHMLDKVNIVDMSRPTYPPATEPVMTTEATEVPTTAETTEAPTTEPPVAKREDFLNILIVGQAAREGEAERFSDTMLLCTLNKFDNSLTVTSLLRDSFVQPPPFRNKYFGQIKLTTVYHMGSYYDNGNPAGSMELMNNTLYDNFGIEVDYNVEINFEAFELIVAYLGGADIELSEAEAKYMNHMCSIATWYDYHFDPGMVHLDGYSALVYARMRKADGDGESDIKRTERQRKLMEALMKQVRGLSVSTVQKIANEILPMITTNMSKDEITDLLKTVMPMLPTMQFKSGGTCPSNYSGVMVDIYHDGMYHSVLKFVPQNEKKRMREITLGEIAE